MRKPKNVKRFSTFKIISAVIGVFVFIASQLLSDRLTGWGNEMIDEWLAAHQGEILAWILANPFHLISSLAVIILLIIVVDWYLGTKKQRARQEAPEEKEYSRPSIKTKSSSPAITRRFSAHLEKIKKERIRNGWEVTGLALRFLNEIKSAPPFLGLRHEKPIISTSDEQTLTEFFLAQKYMEENRDVIKGGRYIIRTGDNPELIAQQKYGHERYAVYVPHLHVYPNGTPLDLPYLNIDRPDHPDDVKRKRSISRDLETIISLSKSYNLTRDDAIPVLRLVYDAAQRTLDERKK